MEMMNDITIEYINWLYDLAFANKANYVELAHYLYETPFYYINEMDGNRYEDGVTLRYRFCQKFGYDQSLIARELDSKPCSVLEMMVALALRIEENILDNSEEDRTHVWFWMMLTNAGWQSYDDNMVYYLGEYAGEKIKEDLNIFMEREYRPDGSDGNIFTTKRNADLRFVEIWCQAMWYITDNNLC